MKEPLVINNYKTSKKRQKKLQKAFLRILLTALANSPRVLTQFPPVGKCTIYSSSTQFSLTSQLNHVNKVERDNKCPPSSNSFRFSIEFTKLGIVPASPGATTLFGYFTKIGLTVARLTGTLNAIGLIKPDESPDPLNPTALITHPIGSPGTRYLVTLQVTPSEAHLSIRSWRRYEKETHHNYKFTFSKIGFSGEKTVFLIF